PLLIEHARQAAAEIAAQNLVAGQPAHIDTEAGDVRFLKPEASKTPGQPAEWVESEDDPTEVLIRAQRTRFRGNPVALFMRELTRQPFGDVVAQVAVRMNNHIVAIRPFDDVPAPVLPLGIWKVDPTNTRKDTWQTAIEERGGKDQYGYDDTQHLVTMQADGIPELTLITARKNGPASEANMQLLDLGTDLDPALVEQQILLGLSREQLEKHDGELRLSSGMTFPSLPQLQSRERTALEEHLGSQRIALLYTQATPVGKNGYQQAGCVEFVAIRVMTVNDLADGRCQIIVQPTVMTTRTAVAENTSADHRDGNPYLFRLELTH
ncbi:MAG: hypothetical protein Q8K78_06970, partial [Planctomycetaceae bacterium]|nr:hypothetical protein [Planctomycetaceae bacterium]